MKRNKLKTILLIVFLTTISNAILAQNMWSIKDFGTSVTSWTWIAFVGIFLFFFLSVIVQVLTLVFWKSGVLKRQLKKKDDPDNLWNLEELESYARATFLKVQEAWKNQDLKSISGILTPELFDKANYQSEILITKVERNNLKGVDIKVVEIIGLEHYKDGSKNKYSTYFEGERLYYNVSDSSRIFFNKKDNNKKNFACTYHFVRQNNQWKLERINNSVSQIDILKSKIWIEE